MSVYLAGPPQPTTRRSFKVSRRTSRLHPTRPTAGVYMWMLLIRALQFFLFQLTSPIYICQMFIQGFFFFFYLIPNIRLMVDCMWTAFQSFLFFSPSVLNPVANLINLLQNMKPPHIFQRHSFNESNSTIINWRKLSHLLRAAVIWLMEDLRGLAKEKNFQSKNVKNIIVWVIYGPVLLCTISFVLVFFVCFLYVALYRLLHNKSYLPDL